MHADPSVVAAGAYSFYLVDVNNRKGTATLMCYIDGNYCGARINLLTGRISKLPGSGPPRRIPYEVDNQSPSPTGDFLLEYDEDASSITVRGAKSNKLDVLSRRRFGRLSDVAWSPRGDVFSFIASQGSKKQESALYAYSTTEKLYRKIAEGSFCETRWSADGRFIAYIQPDGEPPGRLSTRERTTRGTVYVLDSLNDYKVVCRAGKLADKILFSSDSSSLAFTELEKDEYGDYKRYTVQITEVESGISRKIVSTRRRLSYTWTDSGLLVTSYDEQAVPSLMLVEPDGARTKLLREPTVAHLEPLAYIPSAKRVVYTTNPNASRESPDELWAVEPGKPAVKLYPKKTNEGKS